MTSGVHRSAGARLLIGLVLLARWTGCSTILAVKDQQRLADTTCVVPGTVTSEKPALGPLVLALLTRGGDDFVLVDDFPSDTRCAAGAERCRG